MDSLTHPVSMDANEILTCAQELASAVSMQPLMQTILDQIGKFSSNNNAAIYLFQESKFVFHDSTNLGWLESLGLTCKNFTPFKDLLLNKRSILIEDFHPEEIFPSNLASETTPDFHENLDQHHSWLFTPLISKQHVTGIIILTHTDIGAFDAAAVKKLEAYASLVATNIDNALLYEQVHRKAADEERNRLARKLHDSVSQTLFSATLIAEVLRNNMENDPKTAKIGIEELYHLTQNAFATMQTLMFELNPESLIKKPLPEILPYLAKSVESKSNIPITFKNISAGDHGISPEQQIMLYRITQEALDNAVTHASADNIVITFVNQKMSGTLVICDDGVGFDPSAIRPGRIGLTIMKQRAEQAGIMIDITSEKQSGTTITLQWYNSEES